MLSKHEEVLNLINNLQYENTIEEMDNPFTQFTERFNILQILKTLGFTFVPFANIVSLHNCYKRMFNYPIKSKVLGFVGQFISVNIPPSFVLVYPMIYLNCLKASRQETMDATNTASIFSKLIAIYKSGLPQSILDKSELLDTQDKNAFKMLSEKYAKLSRVEDENLKEMIIKEYGVVVFDGLKERINLLNSNLELLSDIQITVLKEVNAEYNIAKNEFFKK